MQRSPRNDSRTMNSAFPTNIVRHSKQVLCLLGAIVWPIATVPLESRAASTMADSRVQLGAGWNVDVPVHPGVELTLRDMKDVRLGFQDRPTSSVSLSAGGIQTVADVIAPVDVDPLPIFWQVSATAAAGVSASAGTLRGWASATAGQTPTVQSYSYLDPLTKDARSLTKYDPVQVGAGGTAMVGWEDVFTITSATLPAGTPVDLRCTVQLHSQVQNPRGGSSAAATLMMVGSDSPVTRVLNGSGSSTLTKQATIGLAVGKSVQLRGFLDVSAHAAAYADPLNQRYGSVGSINAFTLAMNTGHFYVDLEPGVDAVVVSQSGTSYATPLALNIERNGNDLLLSWAASTRQYVLEGAITPVPTSQWETITNAVALMGSRPTVTIPASGSGKYFRLRRINP